MTYAIAIDEMRDLGLSMTDALKRIDDALRPTPVTDDDIWEERKRRAKENVAGLAWLQAVTNSKPGYAKGGKSVEVAT